MYLKQQTAKPVVICNVLHVALMFPLHALQIFNLACVNTQLIQTQWHEHKLWERHVNVLVANLVPSLTGAMCSHPGSHPAHVPFSLHVVYMMFCLLCCIISLALALKAGCGTWNLPRLFGEEKRWPFFKLSVMSVFVQWCQLFISAFRQTWR